MRQYGDFTGVETRAASQARRLLASIALAVAFVSPAAGEPKTRWDEVASHSYGAWGIDFGDQDLSVKAGDDFYRRQNGRWLDRVQFGPNEKAQAYWRDVRILAPRRVDAILAELAAAPGLSAETKEGKAGALYRAYMDDKTLESKGVTPLKPELDAIRAVRTKSQLAEIMGRIAGPETIRAPSVYGRPTGWSFFRLDDINQDRAHPDHYTIYLGAGGLVLPGPEYYLDPQFSDLRKAYVAYIAKTLSLLGWPDPEVRAAQIVDLEVQVARVSWSREEMLDPQKTYNPVTVAELSRSAPGFDWRSYMRGGEVGASRSVVVDAKSAFPKIAAIYAAAPLEVLKARQAFGIADQRSDLLDSRMLAAAVSFRGDALGDGVYGGGGPRTYRAEKEEEAQIGDIVSALYVARFSSPKTKAMAQDMAEAMRKALDARLASLSWMGQSSRSQAREKLARMRLLIGYPEGFQDYAGLKIDDTDLYGDHMRAAAYQWRILVGLLNRPFDASRWSVRPEYPTFNYNWTSNTVEIPAALLVAPFFDENADPAVNYGSVGSTIGATIASALLTRQGLSYDAAGNLHPWLTPGEAVHFSALSKQIADQYSVVEPLPGLHLKGDLLSDEALGDLAGLQIALDAYHASLEGAPSPVLDGYGGDQRFFLGRAQMWRAKFVDSFVRSQITTASNEPPFMRVNGLLPNMDAWYEAFGVAPGDRLYIPPERRVRLW